MDERIRMNYLCFMHKRNTIIRTLNGKNVKCLYRCSINVDVLVDKNCQKLLFIVKSQQYFTN